MAKKAKVVKKTAPAKEGLGIPDLAKHLGIEPATVRVKLRQAKVKKTGKSYTWATAAEMKKVADKLAA